MTSFSREIAIGDIHGCLTALDTLLAVLGASPSDHLIFLGDVIDRGPDSRGVVERILGLTEEVRVTPILGNHDLMMLEYCAGRPFPVDWLSHGGQDTLRSYGGPDHVDDRHLEFIASWADYCESDKCIYTHASYRPQLPLGEQPWRELRWESIRARIPGPHASGKTVVVGHTANKQGLVQNWGHLVCIDTWCFGGGWLTAIEPATGKLWQTNESGAARELTLPPAQSG